MLRSVCRCIAFVCLALILACGGMSGWLYRSGYRLYGVQTGSMRPTFRAGDALLTRRVAADQVHVGDVITYRSPVDPRVLVSHRVIDRRQGSFITKGDNLSAQDPVVRQWQLVGRAESVAPGLGKWLSRLRSPAGLLIAVYLPAALLIAVELVNLPRTKQAVYRLRPVAVK